MHLIDIDTEILVHITAKVTARDDARYRTLASAYLDFEPATRLDLLQEDGSQAEAPPPTASPRWTSPAASFKSVWDNLGSAPVAPSGKRKRDSQQQDDSQDSWAGAPSEVADSMPDNDITLAEFCSPTRMLGYFLQTTDSPSRSSQGVSQQKTGSTRDSGKMSSSPPAGSQMHNPQQTFTSGQRPPQTPSPGRRTPERAQTANLSAIEDASPWSSLVDVVQISSSPTQRCSKHIVPGTSSAEVRATDLIPSSQFSQTNDSDEIVIPLTSRADSKPPEPKRLKSIPVKNHVHVLARSSSDVITNGSSKLTQLQELSPELAYWSDREEVTSAEPAASIGDLQPDVPDVLGELVSDLPLKKHFHPKPEAPNLRPFERGYWVLDLSGWEDYDRKWTWGTLGKFVGNGHAGWGTMGCRDKSWGWIRLYGWEHLAGQLYVLLYLASDRRVRFRETIWYDGGGEVLMTVGPKVSS